MSEKNYDPKAKMTDKQKSKFVQVFVRIEMPNGKTYGKYGETYFAGPIDEVSICAALPDMFESMSKSFIATFNKVGDPAMYVVDEKKEEET